MNSGAARLLCTLFLCTSLMGCGARLIKGLPPGWIKEDYPEVYASRLNQTEKDGQRNWALNMNELAVEALQRNDREMAIRALDEAILEIEVIYGNSEQARQARSAWRSEGSKIFKGDPYERSMTYFYRGILYMQEQAWDNARASFRSALYQDAFAEEQNYNADWATLEFLIGVCEVQLGDYGAANEAFARAEANYQQFESSLRNVNYTPQDYSLSNANIRFSPKLPGFDEKTNLLVITQQGNAPVKKAIGKYGELLSYAPGGGGSAPIPVALEAQPLQLTVTDSVYYQAQTRGGRPLDSVLKGKANFKEVGSTVGSTSAQLGAVVLMSNSNQKSETEVIIGAGLIAIGAISYGIASLIKPEADIRRWENLPESIALWTGSVEQPQVILEIPTPGSVEHSIRQVPLPAPGKGLQVVLIFSPPAGTILPNKDSDLTTTGLIAP